VWRLWPSAAVVELVTVTAGPLRETVDEDGETRVRDRYVVGAPVTGRLSRLRLRAGDSVSQGELVGWLDPAPIDARTQRAAEAAVESAEDARRTAAAAVPVARAALDQALRTQARAESLAAQGHVPPAQREEAELATTARRRELDAAGARAEAAAHEVERARAALFAASARPDPRTGRTPIRAPVAGRVLRVLEESERVLIAGTPVLELGDPRRLEVITDLLSTDAVKVRPGDTMLVEEWGGGAALIARVRVVEPSGFTKVSALGVEEQRVNVIADLVSPPGALGDRYRVEARVVLWGAAEVLRIPLSALVRRGDGWVVFGVRGGRVVRRPVTPGHRGAFEVEVTQGLEAGDRILRYPSDLIREGDRVQAAEGS
jgi:HlyD family secretion protein